MPKSFALFLAAVVLTASAAAQNAPSTPAPSPSPAVSPAPDPSPFKTAQEKTGYALGMEIGTSMRKQGVDIDPATVARGFVDAYSGGKTVLTDDEMHATLTAAQEDFRRKQEAIRAEKADKTLKDGQAFLAANKAKDGVVELPSGLQYKIIKAGDGKKPDGDDTVVCNYRGTFIDGTEFDSSAKHDGPATFNIKGVIKGWTEALQLMPVGSKWQLFVPASLAYGDRGAGDVIPPNSALVFEVELVSIKDDKHIGDKPAASEPDHQ